MKIILFVILAKAGIQWVEKFKVHGSWFKVQGSELEETDKDVQSWKK